jgi:hypothetical protein
MAELSTSSDEAWQEAKRRAEVIRPVAARDCCPRLLVRAAVMDSNLSERQVYALVKRCRLSNGALDALIPSVSSGGRGCSRIDNNKKELVHELIYSVYLSSQRLSAEAFIREVRRRCHPAGLILPSASTIRRSLKGLSPEQRKLRGDMVAPITAVSGRTPILFRVSDIQSVRRPNFKLSRDERLVKRRSGAWLAPALSSRGKSHPTEACVGRLDSTAAQLRRVDDEGSRAVAVIELVHTPPGGTAVARPARTAPSSPPRSPRPS